MSGLSTFQSSPKGSKRVQNDKPRCFWQFGTLLGPSWHFWTISDKNQFVTHKDKVGFGGDAFEQKIIFCLKWSQRVHTPNGQTHLGLQFRTLLKPFVMLTSLACRASTRQFFTQKFWVKSESTPVCLSKNLSFIAQICDISDSRPRVNSWNKKWKLKQTYVPSSVA